MVKTISQARLTNEKDPNRPRSLGLEQIAILEPLTMRQPQLPFLRLPTRPIVRQHLGLGQLPEPRGVLLVGLGEDGRLAFEVVESGHDGPGWTRRRGGLL